MGPILGTEKQRLHRSVCADLAQLINTIRLVSSGGDYGINKDAEDLFCGFLNIVLDCEYPGIQLKNLNMLQDGYPSIDLGDADKKVAVQVTTTEHREKIAHTLKLFFQNKLNQTYDRLIVLIIGKKDSSKKAFLVQDDFRFSAQEDIWDIDRIGVVLGKLSEKKLEEITDYFSQKLYTKQTGALERDKQMLFSEELSAVMAEIRKLRESIAQFPGSRIEDRAEEKQAILRRIHDAPRMVEKIVEPIIYAHDHGMGNGSDGFGELILEALRKMVCEYGVEDYFFNLAIDIFVERVADILEEPLVQIMNREIPENPSKSFVHQDIQALFCAYYGLSLIYKKRGNLAGLTDLGRDRYQKVFSRFPLFYEVQSRGYKRTGQLREALNADRKALNYLGQTKNYAVQNSYASTVAMMLEDSKNRKKVDKEEIDMALQYIDNARNFNPEYPKYDFVKARLIYYSHCSPKENFTDFSAACAQAKKLTDEAEKKLFKLYKGQDTGSEQKKYEKFRKTVDTELRKRAKKAAIPKFREMKDAEAEILKNGVITSCGVEDCDTPPKPHLEPQDAYLYVCFAPQDYKTVYCDIIEMYKRKIACVFDESRLSGEDLLRRMAGHIRNPQCMGVLFYISKFSSVTPSFCEQAKMVFGKKPYIAVNLESDAMPSGMLIEGLLETCERGTKMYPITGEHLRSFLLAFDDRQEYTVKDRRYTEKGTEHFAQMKKTMIEKFGTKICS